MIANELIEALFLQGGLRLLHEERSLKFWAQAEGCTFLGGQNISISLYSELVEELAATVEEDLFRQRSLRLWH